MSLGALRSTNMLILNSRRITMSLFEWFVSMQAASMVCGFISLVFTIGVGYFLIKSLESLKDE